MATPEATNFLSQFDNPYVRKAAEEALQSLTTQNMAEGIPNPEGAGIATLNKVASFSFAPASGQENAVFNSGGNVNFSNRELYLDKNPATAYGDWNLRSTAWIDSSVDGAARLPVFNFNSALMAQGAAANGKNFIPFTDGLNASTSPNSIWAKSEFPASLHEALNNPSAANASMLGMPLKQIAQDLGGHNISNPDYIYGLSRTLGAEVGNGRSFDPHALAGKGFTFTNPDGSTGPVINIRTSPSIEPPKGAAIDITPRTASAAGSASAIGEDAVVAASKGFPTGAVMKGVGIAGTAAMVYDAYTTTQQYQALTAKGNQFGADALLRQYEGRTAGGLIGGFTAGAAYGALAGSESGPGAFVTGAVGGVVGAFAGDKIATYYNERKVNHQTAGNGETYAFENGKWTQTEHHLGLSSYDLPTIKSTTTPAPADQVSLLDYKRTTAATALALANPATQDTKNITLDGAEWQRGREGWTKEVPVEQMGFAQSDEFGRPITISQPADAKTGAQLDQIASNRQFNNDHYAEDVSKAYVMDYYGKGWNKQGPLPETVTNNLKLANEEHIKDPATGHTWAADGKGGFTRDELTMGYDTPVISTVKAEGDELARVSKLQHAAAEANAAYGSHLIAQKFEQLHPPGQQQPTPSSQQAAPSASASQATTNHPAAETSSRAPSAQHPVSTSVQPRLDQAKNPDNALFQQALAGVKKLDAEHGRTSDQKSTNLAAALAVEAKANGLKRIDAVELSADGSRVYAAEQVIPRALTNVAQVDTAQAVKTPIEQSTQQMAQVNQRQAAAATHQAQQPQNPGMDVQGAAGVKR